MFLFVVAFVNVLRAALLDMMAPTIACGNALIVTVITNVLLAIVHTRRISVRRVCC